MKRGLLIVTFLFTCATQAQTGYLKLVTAMLDSIRNVKTLRIRISAVEKIGNTYLKEVSDNKLQMKPRKLYFINPKKKLEILYVEGENNNKAVVKPHVFPYITMSLSPTGNIMRKNQHYTINELGFDAIYRSVAFAFSKEKDNLAKALTYYGKQEKNGYMCHLLVYEAKVFPYREYVVKERETLTSIAVKLNLNDYMIRYKNKLENDYGYLKPGIKLKVPAYYCKKAVFFIDEKTMLPVSVSVFDDAGLLESYDFSQIVVNKPFEAKDFDKHNEDYHF